VKPARTIAAAFLLGAPLAYAGPVLQIVSHSYEMRPQTQTVWFDLVFNRVPDFYHADALGRQADSFWFDVDSDLNVHTGLYADWYRPTLGIDRRISGYDIWSTSTLRIYDQAYGPPVGSSPFSQIGVDVQFEIPYALLAVPQGGAGLYYAINIAQYGGTTQQIIVVPLPRTSALIGAMLVGVASWQLRRRAT
jgi:hypothetical protein